jgi:hypothetical protein
VVLIRRPRSTENYALKKYGLGNCTNNILREQKIIDNILQNCALRK